MGLTVNQIQLPMKQQLKIWGVPRAFEQRLHLLPSATNLILPHLHKLSGYQVLTILTWFENPVKPSIDALGAHDLRRGCCRQRHVIILVSCITIIHASTCLGVVQGLSRGMEDSLSPGSMLGGTGFSPGFNGQACGSGDDGKARASSTSVFSKLSRVAKSALCCASSCASATGFSAAAASSAAARGSAAGGKCSSSASSSFLMRILFWAGSWHTVQ